MIMRNGKVYRIEDGVPGVPRIHHLEFHRACDRWLGERGLLTSDSTSRKHSWLFGRRRKAK